MGDFVELPEAVNAKLRYAFALNLRSHRGGVRQGIHGTVNDAGWVAINAARGWCLNEFGMGNHWDYQHDVFMFEHVDDAMVFKIRWC